MARHIIPAEWYLEALQVFHWATLVHFVLWFTGQTKTRHRRTETVLKRLSKRKLVRTARYGKKLVYALPRKTRGEWDDFAGLSKIAHGLACTEILVRFFRSRMSCEVIPERFFYGLGSVPEWGIRYPNGSLLMLEFTSKSDFLHSGKVMGKLSAYFRNLPKIEEKFQATGVVLFVID